MVSKYTKKTSKCYNYSMCTLVSIKVFEAHAVVKPGPKILTFRGTFISRLKYFCN